MLSAGGVELSECGERWLRVARWPWTSRRKEELVDATEVRALLSEVEGRCSVEWSEQEREGERGDRR